MKKTSKKERLDMPLILIGILIGFVIGIIFTGIYINNQHLMKISSCNSSIQNATTNASIQGYLIRNQEQVSEINNYNMTYVFTNYQNTNYRLKLIPAGEWEKI